MDTQPVAINHFFVCVNERSPDGPLPSCAPAGGKDVLAAFTHEIARLGYPPGLKATASGCLTPCQVGPNVVVYPAGVWYMGVSANDVAEIVSAHLNGTVVDRLLKPSTIRVW